MNRTTCHALGLIALMSVSTAFAGQHVRCMSEGRQYNECYAGFRGALVDEQLSRKRCRAGENWGYNAVSGYIWVSQGCSAVFRESRHGVREYPTVERRSKHHQRGGYGGPHGLGALVDNPDAPGLDPRPQFDKDGFPNFDTHGNWIGR